MSICQNIVEMRSGLHSEDNPAYSLQRVHNQDAGFDNFTLAETGGET